VIRFGWLRDGVFSGLSEGNLAVRFPAARREQAGSVFMEQGIRDIESRLLRELGKPVRVRFEFDESLSVEEEPAPEPEPPRDDPPPEPAAPAKDPMEEFLNDPLIEKALEIFKGTLQTRSA
jgi:hypothetical protein